VIRQRTLLLLAAVCAGCAPASHGLAPDPACRIRASSTPPDTTVYSPSAVDVQPQVLRRSVQLSPPAIDSGSAVFEFVIGVNGRAERESVHVLRSTSAAMFRWALTPILDTQWCPAMIGDRPVRERQHVTVNFRMTRR